MPERLISKTYCHLTDQKKGLKLTTDLGYEYVDARFKPLERLRNIEFTRDCSLPLLLTTPEHENIVTAAVQVSDLKANSLRYQFTEYNRGTNFTGLRHNVTHLQTIRRLAAEQPVYVVEYRCHQ